MAARVGDVEVVIRAWTEGLRSQERAVREATEAILVFSAECAEMHADWFCSLPWYRMWWAMVTGR